MTVLIVGLDGSPGGEKAVEHARRMVGAGGALKLVYVIEWSPFSFQTPEENAARHKRREEEIAIAHERVIDPALASLRSHGVSAEGTVRHGDAADILDEEARKAGAVGVVIARTSASGLKSRIFGSVAANLVMHASVPVTVVPVSEK
ncbi:Nucleotide-binding universal stress protein, UspA family [Rubrimonas cliftonensis]|uniref:Nucleotide-binding universal stress protein, UspA family n=1 Tax=Rubrimonas cliftonensis TaxID=89524 RepID=A0A1H3XDE3_9RHOB|nr:Nucleotide-binding universal stress protein, UspA family [Rubrimonas cliftonensis]